jgi:hypothetical protein
MVPYHVSAVEYYLPKNEKLREKILDYIYQLKSSKNIYQRDLFFRLMTNQVIRKYLVEKEESLGKPLFLQKRKFYQELINEGNAVIYSLYHLINLGDVKESYIFQL